MKPKHKSLLVILDVMAIGLAIATFSPLIIPANQSNPSVMGIPFTLWASFLISILFVILAYLVSYVNKEQEDAD